MEDVAVHELVGDERQHLGHLHGLARERHRRSPKNSEGTRAKLAIAAGSACMLAEQEHDGVGGDETDGDPLQLDRPQGVVV